MPLNKFTHENYPLYNSIVYSLSRVNLHNCWANSLSNILNKKCAKAIFYLSMFVLTQAAHSNICIDTIEKGQNWQDADAAL